jgi:hypothetical protein
MELLIAEVMRILEDFYQEHSYQEDIKDRLDTLCFDSSIVVCHLPNINFLGNGATNFHLNDNPIYRNVLSLPNAYSWRGWNYLSPENNEFIFLNNNPDTIRNYIHYNFYIQAFETAYILLNRYMEKENKKLSKGEMSAKVIHSFIIRKICDSTYYNNLTQLEKAAIYFADNFFIPEDELVSLFNYYRNNPELIKDSLFNSVFSINQEHPDKDRLINNIIGLVHTDKGYKDTLSKQITKSRLKRLNVIE